MDIVVNAINFIGVMAPFISTWGGDFYAALICLNQ